MSLPDRALFSRYAQINVGGRLFTSPPFSLEFSQDIKIGRLTQTKATLYNVNSDTIKSVEPKKIGGKLKYTEVIIDAGYDFDFGTAVLGLIHDYKVDKKGPNVKLILTIGDATSKWANSIVNKSWKQVRASLILTEILSAVGIQNNSVLGEDKLYRTFTARTLRGAIKKITADTNSQYFFKAGQLIIEPKEPPGKKQVVFISPTSGLVDTIQKKKNNLFFKTLYFYKINAGDYVQLEDFFTPKTTVKILKGKKRFSSFGKSECAFEGIPV